MERRVKELARRKPNLREALAGLCTAEVSSKEQRLLPIELPLASAKRLTMARFPFVRNAGGL
jgi:hypothetical protein